MTPGVGEVVMELTSLGFRFRLEGEAVKLRYEGEAAPDKGQVTPLLALVKARRDDVRHFLKCYCPHCGGVASIPDYEGRGLCMGCDWNKLLELYPGLKTRN